MRCYFHRDKEAIGICFYCNRAICEKCSKYENSRLFCQEHNEKMYSLDFTKHYIMAIDLAREAAVKGVRTQDLIIKLEKDIKEAASR